jgi:GTP cyclohydrolase II
LSEIRLLTNNPYKVTSMEKRGITVVDVVNTSIHVKPDNSRYLKAKIAHGNHQLDIKKL